MFCETSVFYLDVQNFANMLKIGKSVAEVYFFLWDQIKLWQNIENFHYNQGLQSKFLSCVHIQTLLP